MGYVREGMNARVEKHVRKKLESSFSKTEPVLHLFGLKKAENVQKLGTPKTRAVFGNPGFGTAKMEVVSRSAELEIQFEKTEPSDSAVIAGPGAATPTAAGFAEDNLGTAVTCYSLYMDPLKIRVQSLEDMRSEDEVNATVEDAVDPVYNKHVRDIANDLWNGSPSAAEQATRLWPSQMGLTHVLTAGNTFGRVDRSVQTNLNPTTFTATAAFGNSTPTLEMIRKVNMGFNMNSDSSAVLGLSFRSESGKGATGVAASPAIWQELASQAEGRYRINKSGIPNHAMGGFDKPVIEFDHTYIIADHRCPAGSMYLLDLDTWMVEVHRNHNFAFTGFIEKWKTEEGGEMYEWGQLHTQIRTTCTKPWCNALITGIA